MKNFTKGLNGISADMLKAVAQVSAQSAKQAAEKQMEHKSQLDNRFESFRPVAAKDIEKNARPIERLYAGMAPSMRTEQKEETIAERVASLKTKTGHQPMSHDSYLQEPKIKLQPKVKRTMEAESVELSAEEQAFIEAINVGEGTTPTKPEHKALAKLAEPKDKVTHKDVLVGRGVIAKEETEAVEEGTMAKIKSFAKKALEKAGGGTDADQLKRLQKDMGVEQTGKKPEVKEETVAEEEKPRSAGSVFDKDVAKSFGKKPGEGTGHEAKKISTGTVYTKKWKKEDEKNEERDTPGQEHVCAVHVKHAKLGEGKTLFSQHAEPDADGNIAWYDVMFAESIERVETKDLEIVVSESHMNHKKKK